MRLVGHAAECRVELADLGHIESPDFHPLIPVVLFKIFGDAFGFRLRDHRMFHGSLREIPPITLRIERGFFARQPIDQPRPLVFASSPDEIGGLQVES